MFPMSKKRNKKMVEPGAPQLAADPAPVARFQLEDDGTIRFIGDSAHPSSAADPAPPQLAYRDEPHGVRLYHANCLEVLDAIAAKYPEGRFDMIFADPPYFLSNGGITCHAGRMVRVDKGAWDKSRGPELNHEFNLEWLRRCQKVLKPNGTIWVSGTLHVIFSVGYAMQQLGYKILNDIAWEKPNPPPNLSCRYFTHSTETILWAAKNEKSKHLFNYARMRKLNGGKQMKTVWTIGAASKAEKKPLANTPRKSPSPWLSAASSPPPKRVTSCWIHSLAAGQLPSPPFAPAANASASRRKPSPCKSQSQGSKQNLSLFSEHTTPRRLARGR